MTDEQIIKALKCQEVIATASLATIQQQKAEIERLTLALEGVMWFVDKWLDGEELDKDEVTRAATMREKTLTIVEGLQEQLATAHDNAMRMFAERVKAHTEHLPSAFYFDKIVDELVEMTVET